MKWWHHILVCHDQNLYSQRRKWDRGVSIAWRKYFPNTVLYRLSRKFDFLIVFFFWLRHSSHKDNWYRQLFSRALLSFNFGCFFPFTFMRRNQGDSWIILFSVMSHLLHDIFWNLGPMWSRLAQGPQQIYLRPCKKTTKTIFSLEIFYKYLTQPSDNNPTGLTSTILKWCGPASL